jgi:hypothetical protein
LLLAIVHAADIQDRDGGILLLMTLVKKFPLLRKLYADGGYRGPRFRQAVKKILRKIRVESIPPAAATCHRFCD